MLSKIKISRNIESEINEQTQDSIKLHINKNIETKLDTYLKPVRAHKADAEVRFDNKVEKISEWIYEIRINISIDWKTYSFTKQSQNNEDVYSLIDNIFKSIKSQLSDEHHR